MKDISVPKLYKEFKFGIEFTQYLDINGEIIKFSLKITIFWRISTLAHHFTVMLWFATKVFTTSNCHKIMGFQMRYVSTGCADLHTYFWSQTSNIWQKYVNFALVFQDFLPFNSIQLPFRIQNRIPHKILHWKHASDVSFIIEKVSEEHDEEILSELRFSLLLEWKFAETAQ